MFQRNQFLIPDCKEAEKVNSIYFKNFMATATVVLTSFLIVGVAFVFIFRYFVIADAGDNMVANADEISRAAAAMTDEEGLDGWDMRMTISMLSQGTGNHIFLCDENGLVISCSDMSLACEHIGKQIAPVYLNTALTEGKMNQLTDLNGFYDHVCMVVSEPIRSDDQSLMGFVFVSKDSSTITGAYSMFMNVFFLTMIAVMSIAMVISLYFSKRMARSLDEMNIAARKYSHGDFSMRVTTSDRKDEMGALVDSFNAMADSLEKSERTRQEFIANVSHELKTPMTTIAGFAEGLLDGTIPKEEEDKYLTVIADETRRLSRLVRDMLSASQANARAADPSRRTVFDLTELVLQTLLSFESRATAKNLDVDPQLPDSHILVIADKDAITQVIYNLLDNAVKFARVGSCLTLRLYKDNGKAYVSIKDEGETIPPDDLPFIFDRFHKSDRSRSLDKDGVGLGLYLVKSIINSHDEDIAVRSEEGVTEFVFTLKLAEK